MIYKLTKAVTINKVTLKMIDDADEIVLFGSVRVSLESIDADITRSEPLADASNALLFGASLTPVASFFKTRLNLPLSPIV